MVLLIDNYDSFSYNLYQLIGSIYDGEIKVVRNDGIEVNDIQSMAPYRIIISPGPGKPSEAGICEEVIKQYYDKIPIFGVCLGHQAICEAFGGTVGYAKKLMHGKTSKILVDGDSRLYRGLEDTLKETSFGGGFRVDPESGLFVPEFLENGNIKIVRVGRYHSLALSVDTLPDCLKVTGISSDGEIMSVEHKEFPVFGVQYHPESILTPLGTEILANFFSLK